MNKLQLILIILIFVVPSVAADKVWEDDKLVYDTDNPIMMLQASLKQLSTVSQPIQQTYTGFSYAFFGGGATDDCTWTKEQAKVSFPSYYNTFSIKCGASKGYLFAQFVKSTGRISGQIQASSEKAMFDYFDISGIQYNGFYTRYTIFNIVTNPTGATIILNNNAVGNIVNIYDEKLYQLKISKEGYVDKTMSLSYDTSGKPMYYELSVNLDALPQVTPTPINKPTVILPDITRISDIIIGWIIGWLPLSISGGLMIDINVGTEYTTSISLDFVAPDTIYNDGTYEAKFGKYLILDSSKNIVKQSDWSSELSISPYTVIASFTPTSVGTYYLIGLVVKQNYIYSSGKWTMTESIETKEIQQVNVKSIQKPTINTPILDLSGLLAWMKSLFTWLPW